MPIFWGMIAYNAIISALPVGARDPQLMSALCAKTQSNTEIFQAGGVMIAALLYKNKMSKFLQN
jgi:hypothetical protein